MRRLVATTSAFVLGTAFLSGPGMSSAVGADGTRHVPSAGTTSIRASGLGPDVLQQPEIRAQSDPDEAGAVEADRPREEFEHGVFPKRPLEAPKVESSDVAAVNPAVQASIEGLNHRDQRLANGGNQFSVEPPDQALCVGGGFTVESVNSVLRVYDESGSPLTGVQDLNTFFKYPAAIDRTQSPPVVGPNVIDPVCHYDPDNKRFIVAITTLHVLPNGDFS
ncbi:MAG: hypothetical protein QOE40_2873, partial [Actinomycetota bacterium]|nr:hypothetical protein [Actinomycetota bacterium]